MNKHYSLLSRDLDKTYAIVAKKLQQDNSDVSNIHFQKLLKNISHPGDQVLDSCSRELLFQLLQNNFISHHKLISEILNIFPFAKDQTSLILLLLRVLKHQFHSDPTSQYPGSSEINHKSSYSISSPTHPLISLLVSHPSSWTPIVIAIKSALLQTDDVILLTHLLRPFLLYALCFQHRDAVVTSQKIFLIHSFINNFSSSPKHRSFLDLLIRSLPLTNIPITFIPQIIDDVITALPRCQTSSETILQLHFYLLSLLDRIDSDATRIYVIKLIQKSLPTSPPTSSLLVLSRWICSSSPQLLFHLLQLVKIIVINLPEDQLQMLLPLKIALLQLLSYRKSRSFLTTTDDVIKTMKLVDDRLQQMTSSPRDVPTLLSAPFILPCFTELASLCDVIFIDATGRYDESEKKLLTYIRMTSSPHHQIATTLVINALIINRVFYHHMTSRDNHHSLLHLLTILATYYPPTIHLSLPSLLYVIKKAPQIAPRVFHTLPYLVTDQHCVAPLLKLIRDLSTSPHTLPDALRMCHVTWKRESRCYSHLQKLLAASSHLTTLRTFIVRDVCDVNALRHAGDMLSVIDDVINTRPHPGVVALAVDGLRALCQQEVLSIASVWQRVLQLPTSVFVDTVSATSLLRLLSIVPQLQSSDSSFLIFREEAIRWIWEQTSSDDPAIRSNSLLALASFQLSDFKVGHLPLELRPPKPELEPELEPEVDFEQTPISGDVIVKLVANLATTSNAEQTVFLLTRHFHCELEDLPRDIRTRALRSAHHHDNSGGNPLSEIPDFMLKSYEKNKQSSLRSIFATSLLMTYNPQLQRDKSGDVIRASMVAKGRGFHRMLSGFLSEVILDPKGWQSILSSSHSWCVFIKRCFNSVMEGRVTELRMQLEDEDADVEDIQFKVRTAGLWTRDKLLEVLKTSSKETSSMQGNSMMGLAGLIEVVVGSEATTVEEDSGYVGNDRWVLQACDTILSAVYCGYETSSRIFSWCQYRSVSNTGKLTTTQIGRISAMHSMVSCIKALVNVDSGRVCRLLACLISFIEGSNLKDLSSNLKLHMTLCCGRVFACLQSDGRYNSLINSKATSYIDQCTRLIIQQSNRDFEKEQDLSSDEDMDLSDLDEDDICEVRLNFIIASCQLASTLFSTSRTETHQLAIQLQSSLQNYLFSFNNLSSINCKIACSMLVLITISGWKSGFVSNADMQQVVKFVEKNHHSSPNDVVLNECLGILFNTCASDIVLQQQQTSDKWEDITSNKRVATKVKISALAGLAASVGSESVYMSYHITENQLSKQVKERLMKVVKLIRANIQPGKDVAITGKAVSLLSRLYLSYEVLAQISSSKLPRDLRYLNENSVLRSSFDLMLKSASTDPGSVAVLQSFAQVAPHFTLPLVDWEQIFSQHLASSSSYKIAISQSHENSSCSSALNNIIISSNLTPSDRCFCYSNLSIFAKFCSVDSFISLMKLVDEDLDNDVTSFVESFFEGLVVLLDNQSVTTQPYFTRLQDSIRKSYLLMPVLGCKQSWSLLSTSISKMGLTISQFVSHQQVATCGSPERTLRLYYEEVISKKSNLYDHMTVVTSCTRRPHLCAAMIAACCQVMSFKDHVTWLHHVIGTCKHLHQANFFFNIFAVSVHVMSCRLKDEESVKTSSLFQLADHLCEIALQMLNANLHHLLSTKPWMCDVSDDVITWLLYLRCEIGEIDEYLMNDVNRVLMMLHTNEMMKFEASRQFISSNFL